ncbi:MAG: sugar-binding transcriptional regulator [Erysipelotrichaceae bacterium]
MKSEDVGLLAEIAYLYYDQNLSQQQIADRLFFSRSKISRMLDKAKELKIISVAINYPIERLSSVEKSLQEKYRLKEVIVVKDYNLPSEVMLMRLCKIGSEILIENLKDGMTVGMSWGNTVRTLMEVMPPVYLKNIHIVQLNGAVNQSSTKSYNAADLIRSIAEKIHGQVHLLHAPLIVQDKAVCQALISDPMIGDTLEYGKKSDIILTGISFFHEKSDTPWEKHLTHQEKITLIQKGAVGTFLAHFIDKNGKIVDSEMDDRLIGINLLDLGKVPNVITIACGENKSDVVSGALKGKYINTLILDEKLAMKLLSKR